VKFARLLLGAGMAVPIIYFTNLFVAEIQTPGVDPWSQLPSDLGVAGLAWAPVFNAGLIAVGAAAALGRSGCFSACARSVRTWSSARAPAPRCLWRAA